MCEASAYLQKAGEDYLIMESVDVVEPDGDGAWRLMDLFGDQKTIHGQLKQMNLVDHKILFEA